MSQIEIPLNEIKQHCRLDESDTLDDTLLMGYAAAALEVCQQHIGKRFSDDLAFTPAIKVGCLLYIGLLYENREMVTEAELKEVPFTIKSLWSVYRDVGVY
ncbi:head-tail connector protein [Xenorhabdus bovienii]|uniref:Bacteriophage protein n=1 Tax=Xenorhabdus bovienii str. kraussei Quebec TaxID=1398203 RepID=A0A077P1S2_XENBV|nr:head-tail connector protein [Xenorhabdus bovienii]MDE1494579.1 head-tail connector protein [Xenorhabdus bovienii]MDE9433179.1 head-tail connector protein [Xenorhabdus bovienii]MDE9470867.1 head-tail connector protein [Xenorhabdus bovienii]MDE9474674.1 head-tail connector protein [Xenorhabdus bovienii]MDE9487709.1 head-tail connector protein [Xenorhabdus bovienii]